jgi:hypothetical protein
VNSKLRHLGMGQQLPNIHCLIDKTMNMCKCYLTKTYLKISIASSCRCIGIAGCLRYNRGSFTQFLEILWVLAKVRWEGGNSPVRLPSWTWLRDQLSSLPGYRYQTNKPTTHLSRHWFFRPLEIFCKSFTLLHHHRHFIPANSKEVVINFL